jgi:carbon monoxide dehydrogenase subunit G
MQIGGERRFEARPAEVYRALTDPDALGAAFAAIERVEADGNDWTLFIRLAAARRLPAEVLGRPRGATRA